MKTVKDMVLFLGNIRQEVTYITSENWLKQKQKVIDILSIELSKLLDEMGQGSKK